MATDKVNVVSNAILWASANTEVIIAQGIVEVEGVFAKPIAISGLQMIVRNHNS